MKPVRKPGNVLLPPGGWVPSYFSSVETPRPRGVWSSGTAAALAEEVAQAEGGVEVDVRGRNQIEHRNQLDEQFDG